MSLYKFEVAISCLNDDINRVLENFENILDSKRIKVHVIHQVTNNKNYDYIIEPLINFSNIRYSYLDKVGLPYSRNYALDNATAKYLIPTDSDVTLFPSSFDMIEKILEAPENTDVDYLTLQSFFDIDQKMPRRKFKSNIFKHNRRTLLSVSSIEIVLKTRNFRDKNVRWDPDFGLGARFGGGLESVMLQTAYLSGLNGIYVPEPLCFHPELSSGAEISLNRVFTRSAVYERIFGTYKGKLTSCLFHIKHYQRHKKLGITNILTQILKDKEI